MSENIKIILIVVLAFITVILIVFAGLILLFRYFPNKNINAKVISKFELKDIKTESIIDITTENDIKKNQ